MSKFADYMPNAKSDLLLPGSLIVRPARPEDTQDVARLAAAREGDPIEKWLPSVERMIDRAVHGQGLLLVAGMDDVIAGYGKADYFVPPKGSPANTAPEGWYLTGVVVRPEYRRRGIGARLTRDRLTWIAQRGDKAFYFANARNLATIDLHKAFGFREVTRDFHHPNATFDGGLGVLFVWESIPSK